VRQFAVIVVLAIVIIAVGVGFLLIRSPTPLPTDGVGQPGDEVVFVGAGDIAECPTPDDEATAALLDEVVAEHPGAVIYTTGDNAYQDGSYEEYLECYDPSWGRFKDRTYPAVGNHEFKQRQAEGYHEYWGERGGPFDKYYYSFDVGSWQVIVLNSSCHRVGCEIGSPDGQQAEWLTAELERSEALCTIAIWHHPRWSSGRYSNDPDYSEFWEILYEHDAEIVLNGHEHLYERFEPLAPDGSLDEAAGIRQFTVGTGGGNLRGFEEIKPHSAARGVEHGVLQFRLGPERYSWEFIPVEDGTFTDSGEARCH
jgi:hypothetical protein